MIRTIKRSIVIMLSFVMTIMISGGVFTTYAATTVDEYTYVANIVDAENNPVQGVTVGFYKDGEAITKMGYDSSFNYVATPVTRTSDASGEVSIGVGAYSSNGIDSSCAGKTIEVKVEGDEYTCSDTHSFELNDSVSIIKIDGTALTYGMSPAIIVVSSASASQEYTVTFNANGGSVDPASAETVEGKLASLPTPTNSNENMVFLGWFTAASGGDAVTSETAFSNDTEIFAHWGDKTAPWSTDDFIYENDAVKGLSDLGKAKVALQPEMIIPDTTPDGTAVKSIAQNAFKSTAITGVTFPSSLSTIGMNAFYGCNSLKEVVIPDTVTTMEASVFNLCSKLESITFSASLTEIPQAVCNGCNSLKNVVMKKGITTIGRNAFNNAYALENVEIPDGVITISQSAFSATHLKKLVLPSSVKTIEKKAFSLYRNNQGSNTSLYTLTDVTLNEGLETIEAEAFNYCAFEEINLPSTVTKLDSGAFGQKAKTVNGNKVLVIPAEGTDYPETVARNTPSDKQGHVFQFKVTFDAASGEVSPDSGKTDRDGKLTSDLPTPVSNAYSVFKGWYSEPTGGEQISNDNVYAADTTIYAQWEVDENVVKDLDKKADDAVKAAEDAKKAADDAKKEADAAKAEADKAAATPGDAAVAAAQKAEEAAQKAATAAGKAKDAADQAKAASDDAKAAADAYDEQVNKEGSTATDDEKAAADTMKTNAADRANESAAAATEEAKAKENADKALADAKAALAKAQEARAAATTSVTVSSKTVNAAAINAAIANAGGDSKYVTTLVLDKGVKKISKGALAGTNVKTLVVKSKKLKKKSVKGSLKGSSVTKVQVKVGKAKTNKKYVKKYKKIFTKKNAGKKAKVKR